MAERLFTKRFPQDDRYELRVRVWEQKVDHENRRTTLGLSAVVKFYGDRQYGIYDPYGRHAWSFSLDGRRYTGAWSYDFRVREQETVVNASYETYDIINLDSPRFSLAFECSTLNKGSCTIRDTFYGSAIQHGVRFFIKTAQGVKRSKAFIKAHGVVKKVKAGWLKTPAGLKKIK